MSQGSASSQSVSEASSSNGSQSGSNNITKPKSDFGKKHRKLVRILTVIAYMISVSTAAVLLSAYYVFLWNPATPGATEAPSMAMARTDSHTSHHTHTLSSFSPAASHYNAEARTSVKNTGPKRSKFHSNFMPTPQALTQSDTSSSSMTHQLSKRSTGMPVWTSASTTPASATTNNNNITPTRPSIISMLSPTNKSKASTTTNPTTH